MRNAFAKSLAHGRWDTKFGDVNISHSSAFDVLLETLLGKSVFHGLRVVANIHDDSDIVGDEFVQERVNGQAFVADGKYGGLGFYGKSKLTLFQFFSGKVSVGDFASNCILRKFSISLFDQPISTQVADIGFESQQSGFIARREFFQIRALCVRLKIFCGF